MENTQENNNEAIDGVEFSVTTSYTESHKVKVTKCSYDSLTLYEVSDAELEILESGSPNSLYLNFAIALISISVSLFISILSATLSDVIFPIFVVLSIVFAIGGAILLILWAFTKNKVDETFAKIRSRKK